ncbi:MAG: membrane dipeptidase [Ignavibacteriaceae bacterium]|nr:membrane dipeptidase [Ignavibacteriaceae bacterium]
MMKNIFLISQFLILFFYTFSFASQISGTVKDSKTHLGIRDVKVEIVDQYTGNRDSVFTNPDGIWYYNLLSSADMNFNGPENFLVYQNYPNPFNPSTRIQFFILNENIVELFVHNILGEVVDYKQIFLQAGEYSIDWKGTGSAGVYFYTIKTGEKSITKKMIQLDGNKDGGGFGEVNTLSGSGSFILSKPQSKNLMLIYSKVTHFTDTMYVEVNGGENFLFFLKSIHSAYSLIDLHNDVLEVMISDPNYHLKDRHNYNHTDIPRLQEGDVDIQFFSVWVSPSQYTNYYQQAQVMLNRFYDEVSQNPGTIAQATNPDQADSINALNKIAAVIGVEGGHHIENSIEKLINLYNAGMRYMTITWNNSTDWAISAQDSRTLTHGLSDFGRQVIRKMDSLGIIIDVSHVGIKTIQDILTETNNPIIASHSGVRAIRDHYRNLYDWQIIDIANTGGVIGVIFYPPFLNGTNNADIDDVIQHIEYIKNLVGIDYIAIGSDFDGIGVTPLGLEDVSRFPNLTSELLIRGYSKEDVEKIMGGNFKRVFEQVCNSNKNKIAANMN